ncbi:hypothetical protein K2X05_11255 [bacterium]|nr:hypothetical protein [bacterium]
MITGLLFILLNLSQALQVHVGENKEFVVDAETAFFLGHSTSIWDPALKTKAANENLVELRKKYQIYTAATVYPYFLKNPIEAASHYFVDGEVDLVVSSVAGQHSGQFPRLKNIFVVGGNIAKCLCEGVRDIVRGVTEQAAFKEVNIYLIRDGIYDIYQPFSPMREDVAAEFVTNVYMPSFNCKQNWYLKKRMKLTDTKVSVFYDGEKLADISPEPQDKTPLDSRTKTINLRFIESKDVEMYLKKIL